MVNIYITTTAKGPRIWKTAQRAFEEKYGEDRWREFFLKSYKDMEGAAYIDDGGNIRTP